jgi:hypothetical protein
MIEAQSRTFVSKACSKTAQYLHGRPSSRSPADAMFLPDIRPQRPPELPKGAIAAGEAEGDWRCEPQLALAARFSLAPHRVEPEAHVGTARGSAVNARL